MFIDILILNEIIYCHYILSMLFLNNRSNFVGTRQDFWLPPLQVKKNNEGRDIMSQGHLGCHIGN
jgi:hypothetical protein